MTKLYLIENNNYLLLNLDKLFILIYYFDFDLIFY